MFTAMGGSTTILTYGVRKQITRLSAEIYNPSENPVCR